MSRRFDVPMNGIVIDSLQQIDKHLVLPKAFYWKYRIFVSYRRLISGGGVQTTTQGTTEATSLDEANVTTPENQVATSAAVEATTAASSTTSSPVATSAETSPPSVSRTMSDTTGRWLLNNNVKHRSWLRLWRGKSYRAYHEKFGKTCPAVNLAKLITKWTFSLFNRHSLMMASIVWL